MSTPAADTSAGEWDEHGVYMQFGVGGKRSARLLVKLLNDNNTALATLRKELGQAQEQLAQVKYFEKKMFEQVQDAHEQIEKQQAALKLKDEALERAAEMFDAFGANHYVAAFPSPGIEANACRESAAHQPDDSALRQYVERETEKRPLEDHQRLRDLVRHCRIYLHQEQVITDDEYTQIAMWGSGSARRLESYDEIRAAKEAAEQELARLREALTKIIWWDENAPQGIEPEQLIAWMAEAARAALATPAEQKPVERPARDIGAEAGKA